MIIEVWDRVRWADRETKSEVLDVVFEVMRGVKEKSGEGVNDRNA